MIARCIIDSERNVNVFFFLNDKNSAVTRRYLRGINRMQKVDAVLFQGIFRFVSDVKFRCDCGGRPGFQNNSMFNTNRSA